MVTLLAILISYFALRESWVPGSVYQRAWALNYLKSVDSVSFIRRLPAGLGFILYVLFPVLLVWGIAVPLAYFDMTPATVLTNTAIAIFLLCSTLRSRRLNTEFQPFVLRWQKQEWQAAFRYGAALFNYGRIITKADLLNQTMTQYLVRVNQCLFAPIFWFVVFDTPGLLFYALTLSVAFEYQMNEEQHRNSPWKRTATLCLSCLEGLSARAFAMTMALMFYNVRLFSLALRKFRVADHEPEIVFQMVLLLAFRFKELPSDNETMAIEGGQRLRLVQSLVRNVFIFWLTLLFLVTWLTF